MKFLLENIYTELIAEHSQSKENRRQLEHATITERGHNPTCGDEITLSLEVVNGVILDAAFTGDGCAISQASTDMMIELLRGKSVDEAKRLAELFIAMIHGEIDDDDELAELDEAAALKNISTMPARVKCATLAWHTLDTAVKNLDGDSLAK
ncbi:MAG: SUF system NifU family Fe-S cluster assembly protein [Selenomonadaceae bacterium]|nr:SUF system NifU family Fe-S cluster assembly protein [Selenomonadaceae bacterium]MBR4382304.1 SUF system NifU family Fe-S cluster assembly protein [Selenomonadaceae bacterium]